MFSILLKHKLNYKEIDVIKINVTYRILTKGLFAYLICNGKFDKDCRSK